MTREQLVVLCDRIKVYIDSSNGKISTEHFELVEGLLSLKDSSIGPDKLTTELRDLISSSGGAVSVKPVDRSTALDNPLDCQVNSIYQDGVRSSCSWNFIPPVLIENGGFTFVYVTAGNIPMYNFLKNGVAITEWTGVQTFITGTKYVICYDWNNQSLSISV